MTKIRRATLEDLPEIKHLFTSTIKKVCHKDYNYDQINVWISSANNSERWKNFILEQYFIVCIENEKITGFCSLKNNNHLDLLYIHINHQRKGLASILYKEVKKESTRLGFQYLSSDVSITAKPFFESIGFKVIKKQINLVDGIEIINYKMSQEIENH